MRLWRWLCCKVGRHQYYRITRVSAEADHVGCRACKQQWGIHYGARTLVPWCEVAGFYEEAKP